MDFSIFTRIYRQHADDAVQIHFVPLCILFRIWALM